MILVTVGTEQYSFNALMSWVDVLIRYQFIDPEEEVVVQYGSSTELPDNVKVYRRLPEFRFRALAEQARLVIAHCGEGTALLLESLDKPYVLVPRTQRYGEHVDDHQLEMADAMEKQGAAIARSPGDLVRFLSAPKALKPISVEDSLCKALSAVCDRPISQKIMLVCSSGGHYKAMQRLKPFWSQFRETSWVTFRNATAEAELQTTSGQIYWAHSPTNRNIPNLVRNLILSFKVLAEERPNVILSTGAGVAVPFLLIAKFLYGSQVIFVESKTRLQQLSLSAKILTTLSGLTQLVVQSQELAVLYPDAIFVDASAPLGLAASSSAGAKTSSFAFKDSILISTPIHLGMREAPLLADQLQTLESQPPKQIVFDMSATKSIEGAGLGALLASLKTAQEIGSKLVLWSVRPEVLAVLAIARLDRLFTIEATTQTIRTHAKRDSTVVAKAVSIKHRPIRRAIDVVGGSMGLLIVTLLFIPISLAIWLDSPGSILSSQIRCGRMGRHFRIWKFRSTTASSDSTGSTLLDELLPKQTRMGRFLVKTNLDKLPMFWNILTGDMSLSGSRAPTMDEIDCYSIAQWSDLDAKPGIVGEWRSTPITKMREFEDIIKLDPQY